ncbi:MAG: hypothetical protein ACKO5E_08920, partial [bacterium]
MSDFTSLPKGFEPASKPADDETSASRSQESIDRQLDQAIDSKTKGVKTLDPNTPLKKVFDEEIEAELNEFLDAFDTKSIESVLPAPKGAPKPKGETGKPVAGAEVAKPVSKGKTGKIVKITKDWVFLD